MNINKIQIQIHGDGGLTKHPQSDSAPLEPQIKWHLVVQGSIESQHFISALLATHSFEKSVHAPTNTANRMSQNVRNDILSNWCIVS